MDLHQLKTFVAVAREGTITRASEVLHLSQPAVSAHIKTIEDTLGLSLFERTPKGMSLTRDGQRLLAKAEQTLAAHRELMDEATRSKGQLSGKLRLGVSSSSPHAAIGRLLATLSERHPEVEVALKHSASVDVVAGLRNGSLDCGFYNEGAAPTPELSTVEVSRFRIDVVAPPGMVAVGKQLDWKALAELAWIYPTTSACCGQTAERLFAAHKARPKRIISVDREDLTRTLVASGVGVGLLHEGTSREAQRLGEVELVHEASEQVRVLFANLASRAQDPLVAAATSIVRAGP